MELPLFEIESVHLHWLCDETASQKVKLIISSVKFLSSVVVLYFYESTIQPYLKYCRYVEVESYLLLDMFDEIQKQLFTAVVPTTGSSS